MDEGRVTELIKELQEANKKLSTRWARFFAEMIEIYECMPQEEKSLERMRSSAKNWPYEGSVYCRKKKCWVERPPWMMVIEKFGVGSHYHVPIGGKRIGDG